MRLGRRAFARLAVVALLAVALVAVIPGSAHADSLTSRTCQAIHSGDGVRRLDVCARGWVNNGPTLTRSVVEMHTYAWSNSNGWIDSRSQSITMNDAITRAPAPGPWYARWGQDISGNCRVNGPGGSVACSVPNTTRVAFYGPAVSAPNYQPFQTEVFEVSWRDDRGVPHTPVYIDLVSPTWNA